MTRQERLIEYFRNNFSYDVELPNQRAIADSVKINIADISKTMLELETIGFLTRENKRTYRMNSKYFDPERKRRLLSVANEAFSLCRAS